MSFKIDNYKLILFDFDGVIVNTEWLHFAAFNKVLQKYNTSISKKEYLEEYLAFDDRDCFKKVFKDKLNTELKLNDMERLIREKNKILMSELKKNIDYYPDAIRFINYIYNNYNKIVKMCIVSGALKTEILYILRKLKMINKFFLIVSAEDVQNGKPSPEPFLFAKRLAEYRLGKKFSNKEILVVEDSINGIKAGLDAGFDVLAVAHTYSLKELKKAKPNFIVKKLDDKFFVIH